MLRMFDNGGWWLVTHVDHAELAGRFAERWGNARFLPPEPRADVLTGIARHDDGWRGRDACPPVTRAGLPGAFSRELVGKYSAFEEIDLADYLAVRRRAVAEMAATNAYAAVLVSMHTYDLLSTRADRSTIATDDLPQLDAFLTEQRDLQRDLRAGLTAAGQHAPEALSDAAFLDHFRLLQACDNLSLLACVDYPNPANLLHSLPTHEGGHVPVTVEHLGPRHFRLSPGPFAEPELRFGLPARHVSGERFRDTAELVERFHAAPVQSLAITVVSTD